MNSTENKKHAVSTNTSKTLKNSIIAIIAQIISLVLVFVNRKVFVLFLDIEYLGYQSLFSNIFTLLSVAELGIGTAISFHLYKEVVNKNEEEIGRLMYVYKIVYQIISIVVLVVGIGCYFLIPFIVKETTLSPGYLATIYFLQLASVFVGYFLSYKQIMFVVTQQEYKITIVTLLVNIIVQALQLLFLFLFKNYLVYLILNLSTSVIINIILALKINKEYPFLRKKYTVTKGYLKDKNFFQDVKNVAVHKIAYAVYGGTDNIIVSSFLGVVYVAFYGNYLVIQKSVMDLLVNRLINPIQATIGNIIYSNRSKEELWQQFQTFDIFSFCLATFISLGFFVFYQPFIELWMGKDYLLPFSFVILFCITIYFGVCWEIVYRYRSVFGDYKQDVWFMVLSAIVNIGVSIPGAIYLGITGIQLGTLVAFFFIAMGRIRFVVKNYFKQSMIKYLLKHLALFAVVSIEGVLCFFVTKWMPVNIPFFLLRFVVWIFIPLLINVLVLFRNQHFRALLVYFRNAFNILFRRIKNKKNVEETQ